MINFLRLGMLTVLFILSCRLSFGQEVAKKRLMRNINVPLKSHIFPSLTADGLYMVFYSDYTNTGNFELKYSKKTGYEFWEEAKYVENLVKHHNDHFGSYSVSHDGRYMYFTSHRASGIGKYDIWLSERKGDMWSTPINPGKPLNSPENDGNPNLSPDGRSIYFMRCQSMDAKTKGNCKIYVAHKISQTRWGEPQALPENINAYHSTTPRILADNETLIYSSERPGGKGGLDLYMTRRSGNEWSEPIPLDFINSARNDEFVSVPARGDIIYYTDVYKDQHNIYKAVLPEAFRPKKILMITGSVSFTDKEITQDDVQIQVFDTQTGTLIASVKPDENSGNFFLSLPEGKVYDFSVFPRSADHIYYSEIFDLTAMASPKWEKLELPLDLLRSGGTIELSSIIFDEKNQIHQRSAMEFKRLMAVIKKNPHLNVEVGVHLAEVITDSVPAPGLNKIISDTSFFILNKSEMFETGEDFGRHQEDSLHTAGYIFLEETDTTALYFKIKNTYTNDDTQEKADAIVEKLKQAGANPDKLLPVGYSDREKPAADGRKGYWIEIRFY